MRLLVTSACGVEFPLRWGARYGDGTVAAVVSIGDPGEPLPYAIDGLNLIDPSRILRLEFEDVGLTNEAAAKHIARYADRYPDGGQMMFDLFEPRHIDALVAFVDHIPTMAQPDDITLVHCAAGVSRSTATASVIAALTADIVPDVAIAVARAAHQASWQWDGPRTFDPNPRVLALGSRHLFGDDRLVEAWARRLSAKRLSVDPYIRAWLDPDTLSNIVSDDA